MLPILAAFLAFITIGGVGWVLVSGDDGSGQAVKRAKAISAGRAETATKRAAVVNTPEARRKQILLQLQEVDRRDRKARMTMSAKLKQADLAISLRTFIIISVVLGLVGAGGIGAQLIFAIQDRRWSDTGAMLWGLVILVLTIEYISTKIRNSLAVKS